MVFRMFIGRAMALLVGVAAISHAHACSFEQAHYRYTANHDIEVSFKRLGKRSGWMSNLALHLTIRGGASYWFMFDRGSAHYINMISVEDTSVPGWTASGNELPQGPLQAMHFFAWSKGGMFFESLPMEGLPAPDTIFLPDLSEALWYQAQHRIGVNHGLFVRYRCA